MQIRRSSVAVLIGVVVLAGRSSAVAATDGPQEFPFAGLLPKEEVGAVRFLEKHPDYDGRGVIVAVLDTGIDPGAAGLQVTSHGQPKILDMADGTGSGDVDMTELRQPVGNVLEGLSGRKLQLAREWLKRDREFHVGCKRGFDFFPRELIERLKKEHREKFDAQQGTAEERVRREIAAWEQTHPQPTEEEQAAHADLVTRLTQLDKAAEDYQDPGPLYDCVVFHDGEHWRAVIDTNEDGDLTNEKVLTNFRVERQYATFGDGADLNFAVNCYDEGRRLSIVTCHDAHGTHVAGIVAGHFPDQPEQNGLAPGAQLVSVKIGDTRLGGSETVSGLVRGLKTVLDNHCDLVNMSYGEPTSHPNRGQLIELFEDLVDRHGVVFVAAVGNDGPALSSVIAPGGTSSALLGIGAYVSPQMAAAEYSLRHPLEPMPYTWSSRGPAFDGDLGVRLLAPGGAISPVPTWTLDRYRHMNGTSMASPNACGAVALLLSAAKAEEISYSPNSLRRALENTAENVNRADAFAQGAGLIQVDRAWDHLRDHATAPGELLRFHVEVSGRELGRGIYLRELFETRRAAEHTVKIEPRFPHTLDNPAKREFEMKIALESTEEWVRTGNALLLTSSGRTIQVHVDPRRLEPGAHFAEVVGYDATNRDRGPMFRIPVTVIICHNLAARPHDDTDSVQEADSTDDSDAPKTPPRNDEATVYRTAFELISGKVQRRFVWCPFGAAWVELKLRRADHGEAKKYLFHALQRIPDQPFTRTDTKHLVRLNAGEQVTYRFPVDGGRTLEVCIAQDWSNYGTTKLEWDLKFHGMAPEEREIVLPTDQTPVRLELASLLRRETIQPRAHLTKRRRVLLPAQDALRPLDPERDRQPDGKQRYELLLTYEFSLEKAAHVTVRFPQTDDQLYDAPLGGRLWMLFDAHKRRLAVGSVTVTSSVALEKGKYTLRLPLRHDDPDVLQPLRRAVLYLEQPLAKFVPVKIFASKAAAVSQGKELEQRLLLLGEQVALHLRGPATEDLPADVKPGDWLLGSVTFFETERSGEGPRADRCRLLFAVPPAEKDNRGTRKNGTREHCRKTAAELAEDVRDYEVSQLQRLVTDKDEEVFQELAAKLREKYPEHLPVLAALLRQQDAPSRRLEKLAEVVQTADEILKRIDRNALALQFVVKGKSETRKSVEPNPQANELREILVDALYRKGLALADRELPDVLAEHPLADREAYAREFEEVFGQLQKWVDTTDDKYAWLHARREWRHDRLGSALAALNKYLAHPDAHPRAFEDRRQLYHRLGWQHLAEAEAKWQVIRFPRDFEPF